MANSNDFSDKKISNEFKTKSRPFLDRQMTLILVLIFFKSICLYLQNIVLNCYDKFLNPRRKYLLSSSSSGSASSSSSSFSPWSWLTSFSSHRNYYRASLRPSSSKNQTLEREQLLEQIRARKRAKARSRQH